MFLSWWCVILHNISCILYSDHVLLHVIQNKDMSTSLMIFLPWSFCIEYTLFGLKTSVNSTGSSGVSPITSVQLIMNLCYMCYISFSKRCVSYVSCAPFFQFWFSSLSVFDSVKFMTRKEKWILKANTLYLWHFICLLRSTGCWKQTLLHTKCSIPEVNTIGLR
jgi:hypothetical protein